LIARRHLWWLVPCVIVILLGIGLISLRAAYRTCCTYTITYTVRGTASSARIVYHPGDTLLGRSTLVDTQTALPWGMLIQSDDFLHRRLASVQVTGTAIDTLTCEVWINGQLAETHTNTGSTSCAYDPERNPVP
jgi:hypothetical protein